MPNTRQEIKAAVLEYCADHGLTIAESTALVRSMRVKAAELQAAEGQVKQAVWPWLAGAVGGAFSTIGGAAARLPGQALTTIGPTALAAGTALGIGIPAVAGLAGGHAVARATDDDTTLDEAKARELIDEYRQQADRARRHAAVKQLRDQLAEAPSSKYYP